MAIKINTAYGERLTSSMLNEKISGIVGENEKVNGFDVSINTSTSVAITPGRAYVNGCSIEETSNTNVSLDEKVLSNDGLAYIVLNYAHEAKKVEFSCVAQTTSNMVKLATVTIKDRIITELINHSSINTLNTVVGESADLEAQKIRDSIPSGFVELGQLDYDYMLNYENKVKIVSKSVAYVNGYRVEIPAGTIVDIGKAPKKESREDLLFLEAWKDSDFAKSGKLKWRIRHVASVDFNLHGADGLERIAAQHLNGHIHAQGGLTKPPFTEQQCAWITEFTKQSDDVGLYKTANHTAFTPTTTGYLNTVDNQSYAIPMFRIYRKPSCGKSTPFEYSKINPTVDYSKFVTLMKEEKVERVIGENIQGRSLVNLIKGRGVHDNFHGNAPLASKGFGDANNRMYATVGTVTGVPSYAMLGMFIHDISFILHPNKKYTIVFDSNGTLHPDGVAYTRRNSSETAFSIGCTNPGSCGRHMIVFNPKSEFTRNDTDRHLYFWFKPADVSTGSIINIENIMLLEGDWTNKEIPAFFTGLKSLAEEDGNLITIKNGILNDSTYDANDENQKLITFSGVTHILSENAIIPNVQATIEKGGESKALNGFGTKLTTDGTETVAFTNIRGRTLHNCYPKLTENAFKPLNGSINNGYIVLQGEGLDFRNAFIPVGTCSVRPDTRYTMMVDITENTLKYDLVLASTHGTDIFTDHAKIAKGARGIHRFLLRTVSQITKDMFGLRAFISASETGKVKFKVMLLEGDYTNTPLDQIPFIDGIQSIGENNGAKVILKSCGKNLFDANFILNLPNYFNGGELAKTLITIPSEESIVMETTSANYWQGYHRKLQLKPNTTYTLSYKKEVVKSVNGSQRYHSLNISNSQDAADSSSVKATTKADGILVIGFLDYSSNGGGIGAITKFTNIQLEEGETKSPYEPVTQYKQEIHLKEPLRSLPTAYDEIIGNKIIRRIHKLVLDGSENWIIADNSQPDTIRFLVTPEIPFKRFEIAISDKFAYYGNTYINLECFTVASDTKIHVRILRNKLNPVDASGFKQWLSNNPLTIYYVLQNPVEEYLENVYQKESIKTYQLDAPLRSLPNGVKDEIEGGVLTRRCGEITLDGSSDEVFQKNHDTANYTGYYLTKSPTNYKNSSVLLCDKLKQSDVLSDELGLFSAGFPYIYIKVPKTTTPNEYLKANPVKIVYELNSPVQTTIAEVEPRTANFTPQRQCVEGTWLRELPNGVKDTVENNKVIRRVGRKVINGTESWTYRGGTGNPNIVAFSGNGVIPCSTNEHVKNMISDTLPSIRNGNVTTEGVVNGVIDSYAPIVFIDKRKLSSVSEEGFKEWLSKNPMTVLFELKQTTEESLNTSNHMPYPYHDINTCCGNMYIGEGRNYILNKNKIPSGDPIVVDTDFRMIESKARVEDCKYKKCDDGYDTSYISSSSANLLDTSIDNILNTDYFLHYNYTKLDNGFRISNKVANPYSSFRFRVHLKAGVSYRIEYNKTGDYSFVDLKTLKLGYIRNLGHGTVFTVDTTGYYSVNFYCTGQSATIATATFTNVSIVESKSSIPFEPYIKTKKYLEGIEENDIEDLRHQVSLTGFNYDDILQKSFDKLLRGEL